MTYVMRHFKLEETIHRVHSSQKYRKEENIIQDDNDTIEDEEYFPENNHDNLKSMVLAPANSSKI